jgi:hypothetical protein
MPGPTLTVAQSMKPRSTIIADTGIAPTKAGTTTTIRSDRDQQGRPFQHHVPLSEKQGNGKS